MQFVSKDHHCRQRIEGAPLTIDTKRFEALGVQSAQRQIDMQIRNAQSYVPVPQRIPGLR